MVKAIIIDPGLNGVSGHHLSLSVELAKAAKALGHEPVWLANERLNVRLVPNFVRFVPAFSSSIYERQIGLVGRVIRPLVGKPRYLRAALRERDWEIWLRNRYPLAVLNGDRCAELVRALDAELPEKGDHLILHSAEPQTIDMLVTWAKSKRRDTLPQINIRTCWSRASMPFPDYAGGFSQTFERLCDAGRAVTLSSETPAGALELERETRSKVNVCPHLLSEARLRVPQPELRSVPLVVGWLGEPRPEKGTEILADIIRSATHNASTRVKFLLQCGGRTSRKARALYEQLEEFGDSVELLDSVISENAYLASLTRCHMLLLPYDPKAYPPERGSGAALEALMTGRPMVVAAGTFAASLVTPESGIVASDSEAFGSGIQTIAARYHCYFDGAKRSKERARISYSRDNCYRSLIGFGSAHTDRGPEITT